MKTRLCLSLACIIAVVAVAEPRTWTFTENGKIRFQSGSMMSFAKGGRIDAEFVRADTTNVFLKLINAGGGQDGCVPVTSLSEADLLYVESVNAAPIDVVRVELDALAREARNQQHAQVVAKETAKKQAQEAASVHPYMTLPKSFGSRTPSDVVNENMRKMGVDVPMMMQEGINRAMRDDEESRQYARARRQEELRILAAEGALKEQQLEAAKVEFEERQRNAYQNRSASSADGAPRTVKQIRSGSGFFVTDNGYFLTCNHVIDKCEHMAVKVKQQTFPAVLVKSDDTNDLALLKVSGSFRPLPFAPGSSAKLGDSVFTMGFPNPSMQGIEPKLTKGEINGLAGIQDDPRHFQVSVAVQPGNSGGPLVNQIGNVVGVVRMRLNDLAAFALTESIPQSVNYALKCDSVTTFLESIPELSGRLKTPYPAKERKFDDVVKEVQEATAMVIAY
jgi:S1-C subfamily serine protease